MSTAAAVAAASAMYNGNMSSAILAAGYTTEFTYKPPPDWLSEKKATQLRKHADCCVRMDCTTHAIVISVQHNSFKNAGDNMKELWNKAVPALGSGADEQRLLLCAHASHVTLGPLECSDSGDCWFFSIDCGSRPLYLLWLCEDRDVNAEALHASLSAFTDGAAAHAAAASSGVSPESCSTAELIKNLCWQQASHMLFPMWHAVCRGNLPESCQPDAEDDSGLRAVHVAAARHKLPMLTQLKQMGCDLDATDFKGRSPLAIACMAGLVQIVRHLLLCGASVSDALWTDASPLFVAIAEGRVCLNDAHRIPVFTALVLEREGSASQEKSGMSFLQLSCSMGSLSAVRLLLDRKRGNPLENRDSLGGAGRGVGGDRSGVSAASDINALSSSNFTALHIATRHRFMEIVKLLLLNGANANALTADGCSALELCLRPAVPPPPAAAPVHVAGGGDGSPGPKSDASLASVLASHGGRIIRNGKSVSPSECNACEDVSEAIFAGSQAWASAPPLPLPPALLSTLASVAMVPDDASSTCLVCSVQFSLFNRRHHCRVCGLLLCDDCCNKRVSRPPAASLERCCDSCFNKIRSRVLQLPALNPSPPPPLSRLADSSPVAPPSFEEWQQQEQQSDSLPAVGEARARTKEEQDAWARQRAEEEFTRDLREAQNEMQGGSKAVGSASDAVRDTRDALVKRGQMLKNAADRSQRLQDAAQNFSQQAAELKKKQEKNSSWLGF